MQNLRFVSSAVPGILGIPKVEKKVRWPRPRPFWLIFHFFRLASLTINAPAKFEVYIFSRSRDIRGSQNLKNRSRDHSHAPFWPLFSFFCLVSLTIDVPAKFEVCIFSRSRDIRIPKFEKKVTWPRPRPFWLIFHFFSFSIPYGQCASKIWGLYLQPFQRY